MFTFSGTIGRKDYAIRMALVIVEFLIVTSILLLLAKYIDNTNGSAGDGVLTVLLILAVLNTLAVFVAQFSLIMRRSRDIGYTVLLTVLALLFSPVMFILALIPGKHQA